MTDLATAHAQHVLFLALYRGDEFVDPLVRTSLHLNASASAPLPIRFHAVVTKITPRLPVWYQQHEIAKMPDDAKEQHRNLTIGKRPGAHVYLWKPFLYRLLTDVDRLLVLDLDVVLVSGSKLQGLWGVFDHFDRDQVLGVAFEQGPTYGRAIDGRNGGVQLQHLARMRDGIMKTSSYDELLREYAAGGVSSRGFGLRGWDRTEPNLGDQTLYTHLCGVAPQLCHRVPCGWNRQMSTRYYTSANFLTRWHNCSTRCHMLHFNQPLLEQLVPELQRPRGRTPDCAECRGALARLENRTRAARSSNPKFSWGESKQYMARMVESCCCGGAHHGHA